MKQRLAEKQQGVSIRIPKRTLERYSEAEQAFILEMVMQGYKPKGVTERFNARFDCNRSEPQITQKIYALKKKGISKSVELKELEGVTTSFLKPETTKECERQLEVAMSIIHNVMGYIKNLKAYEQKLAEDRVKFNKIKNLFNEEEKNSITIQSTSYVSRTEEMTEK